MKTQITDLECNAAEFFPSPNTSHDVSTNLDENEEVGTSEEEEEDQDDKQSFNTNFVVMYATCETSADVSKILAAKQLVSEPDDKDIPDKEFIGQFRNQQ